MNGLSGNSSQNRDELLELYQDLVETSQDLIWQCDAQGCYTYLNPAWSDLFGYSLEEMIGHRFTDFQDPLQAENDVLEFSRLLAGGMVKGFETIHRTKNGDLLNIVFNAKQVVDKSGNILGTRGTAYDITARKKVEKELFEREEQYRALVSQMQLGLAVHEIILDEKGLPVDYRFLYVNDGFEKITGLKREEILGRCIMEIMPTIEPLWIKNYGTVALTGKSMRFEGFSKELDKHFDVVAYRPREGEFAVIISDVTDR